MRANNIPVLGACNIVDGALIDPKFRFGAQNRKISRFQSVEISV